MLSRLATFEESIIKRGTYLNIVISDKQLNEYKEMVEAIQGNGKLDNKDKKIIDLAKKNRAL